MKPDFEKMLSEELSEISLEASPRKKSKIPVPEVGSNVSEKEEKTCGVATSENIQGDCQGENFCTKDDQLSQQEIVATRCLKIRNKMVKNWATSSQLKHQTDQASKYILNSWIWSTLEFIFQSMQGKGLIRRPRFMILVKNSIQNCKELLSASEIQNKEIQELLNFCEILISIIEERDLEIINLKAELEKAQTLYNNLKETMEATKHATEITEAGNQVEMDASAEKSEQVKTFDEPKRGFWTWFGF